jgi:transposase-like protein
MENYNVRCPYCFGTNIKKSGLNSNKKKQRFKCKSCKRHFTLKGKNWFVSEEQRQYIDRMLAERISLRGICRVTKISLSWLMVYVRELYMKLPDDLNYILPNDIAKSKKK